MPGYHQSPLDIMLATQVVNPQTGNNTTVNGTAVDMAGWDGVYFVVMVGATDTTVDAKLQDSADGTTFADISGASLSQWSATDDNKAKAIDIWRPSRRYVRPVVTIGAGTSGAVVAVLAVRYRGTGRRPPTQDLAELKKV